MNIRICCTIYLLMNLENVKKVVCQNINGDTLAGELNKVADAVGRSFMQDIYDKMKYTHTTRNGGEHARDIAKKISQRMENMKTSLSYLKQTMENTYDQMTTSHTYQDCCMDGNYEDNLHFRTQVSLEEFCYSKPSYVKEENIKYPTRTLLGTMKTNHQNNKNLQFQYIALNSGLFINYPATKLTGCDTYDPRFRPFFVASTTTTPRDIVMVIDISASLRGHKLTEARHAFTTVIETLSVKDKIAIVVFNDEAESPGGCYDEMLVPVTNKTREYLKGFLSAKGADGGSNYAKGLRKAFSYLKTNSSEGTTSREQIILFLTDGENTAGGDNPLEVIRDENQQLQNRVVINTYGIGTSLSSEDKQLLQDMSEQKLNNNSYGYVKAGKSVIIADIQTTSLSEVVGTYYDYSSVPISQSPTYTQPYKDLFSKEFVMTGCLPIEHRGAFVGVVCADILLSELVSEILYLQEGEHSYAFIIDGEERTLIHPLLPDPRDVTAEEYDVNNIYSFETAGDVHDVINSMKKGQTGDKMLLTTVIETRGKRLYDGDSQRQLDAVYYWTPIVAPGSNLSLCLVLEKNSNITTLNDLPRSPTGTRDFVYHRWDLTRWPPPYCRHFNRYATKATTTVKLTPDAFTDPLEYNGVEETEQKVQQYVNYLSGTITTNPGLKTSAINSIRATYPIEDFWKTISSQEAPYLVWRYIMTEDGVNRMYPGIRLTNDYDHKLRPWYRRTVSHKLLNVISAPYEDSWGSGKVISLTRTILKRGTNQAKIEAVLGTDFSIFYFNQLLKDKYPVCSNTTDYSCIVIDNSGFLVMHPYYIETTSPIKEPTHITYKEGKISQSLIAAGIMFREPCRDTEKKKEQFTYRVRLPQSYLNGIVDSTNGYEMRPVNGSNVFLILKQRELTEDSPCCTAKSSEPPSELPCGAGQCTCLCYENLDFNDCENKYTNLDENVPCNPKLPTLNSVSIPEEDKNRNLDTCFPTNCPCRKTERECFRTSGCSWCTSTREGKLFDLIGGFCDLKESCPIQKCVSEDCSSKCCGTECYSETSQSSMDVAVVAPVVSVVVIIIIAIVVVILHKRRPQADDTYFDPVHDDRKFSSSDSRDCNAFSGYFTISAQSVHSEEDLSPKY